MGNPLVIYIIYVMGSCRSFRLGSAPERSPTFGENNSQAADMITFKCPGIAIIKNHPTSCFWVAALCNQKNRKSIGSIWSFWSCWSPHTWMRRYVKVTFFSYMYFTSQTWSLVGCLVAGFGVYPLMEPCITASHLAQFCMGALWDCWLIKNNKRNKARWSNYKL